ncbi:MAG: hypothetical protein WKG32_06525 [Gemmatimonadaceae bacterium]
MPTFPAPHRRLAILLALLAGGVGVACSEVGSDPRSAVAIELDPTERFTFVVGDSLRDTTGAVIGLVARALNSSNDVITDAPLRFLVIDTGIAGVDSLTGKLFGRRVGQVTVIASVGGLQSERITLRVTQRPDTVVALDSLRRFVQYSPGRPATASSPLRVFVGYDTVTATGRDTVRGVSGYLVRFRIIRPGADSASATDTSRVALVNESNRLSTDTLTDASGVAARRIRFSTAVAIVPDSVVVEARVVTPSAAPVPGSPARFTIRVTP